MRKIKNVNEPIDTEGDINLSPRRLEWSKNNIDTKSQKLLSEDSKYFLHQSLSTPCLNVLGASDGIYLEDLQGRKIMDFLGNSVHQVGHGNKRVIEAIKEQLDIDEDKEAPSIKKAEGGVADIDENEFMQYMKNYFYKNLI